MKQQNNKITYRRDKNDDSHWYLYLDNKIQCGYYIYTDNYNQLIYRRSYCTYNDENYDTTLADAKRNLADYFINKNLIQTCEDLKDEGFENL